MGLGRYAERDDQERQEIKAGAKRYDEYTAAQAEAQEKAQQITFPPPYKWLEDMYLEMENTATKIIRYLGYEIGVMVRMQEKSRKNDTIRQYCRFYIDLDQAEIEDIYAEIEGYRARRKELQGLSG